MKLVEYLRRRYLPAKLDISDDAAKQIECSIGRFGAFLEREPTTADLSEELVQAFLFQYRKTAAAATVNSKRRDLLALWRQASKHGLAGEVGDVPRAREPKRIPQAWTVDEVSRLLAACRKVEGSIDVVPAKCWWESLVLVIYDTSCRISALLETPRSKFDRERGQILVAAETQKQYADQLFSLSPQTAEALAASLDAAPGRELIWPWPYYPTYVWRRFRAIVEAAGVPADGKKDLFHKLRRTCLSYVAATDPRLATELAGHASSATTWKHYIDPRIAGRGATAIASLPRPN